MRIGSKVDDYMLVKTSFDPHLYSSGSSLAGPTLVYVATARSYIFIRGIVTDNVCHAPRSQDGMQCIPFTKAVVSQVGALWMGLQACED